ncbi:hypothetical protein [Micromonospora coriariae]|uniref:hypothetical protein n=1 Tax=Micromonospora coriariae TaxID=285665 RepID=UPI000B5AEAA9|nr:hypothetical protein [Micromonospora coriariae]
MAEQREGFIGDRKRFARDVLVNVLANLVAAAIIYMLAALVGLLPRNAAAFTVAGSVLAITLYLLWHLSHSNRRLGSLRGSLFAVAWVAAAATGIAAFLVMTTPLGDGVSAGWRPVIEWLFYLAAAVVAGVGFTYSIVFLIEARDWFSRQRTRRQSGTGGRHAERGSDVGL